MSHRILTIYHGFKLGRIITFSLLLTIIASCSNNPKTVSDLSINSSISKTINTEELPIIQFDKDFHDFGLIQQGEKVSYTFKFKNIGKGDLLITDASASCGCTVPKFSKKPIRSGEDGEIEVVFDSNNRLGRQLKSITVWTNCKLNKIKLQITSEIVSLKK